MRYKKIANILKTSNTNLGFTLIELLIVIVIIGILSGILVSVIDPVKMYNKGKYAKAQAGMDKFIGAVTMAQVQTGLRLGSMTGTWCSSCTGCSGIDLRDSTGQCYTNWISARDAVSNTIAGQVDLSTLARDPWGSPYLLNENEGEIPANPCVYDSVTTAGPDGYYGTSDDQVYTIPFSSCH
jgi:prepilin-type N-terminal cleavage/methylation domain-containing protein